MNILAIETSSDFCSVAVAKDDLLFEKEALIPQQHAQVLLTWLDELFDEAQLDFAALNAIAYSCGPGSFTGIRIGAAVAQGLALTQEIITLAVPSLQVIAQGIHRETGAAEVIIIQDARMDQFYYGCYRLDQQVMQASQPDRICNFEELQLAGIDQNSLIVTDSKLIAASGLKNTVTDYRPKAVDVLFLGRYLLDQGVHTTAMEALPIYLRPDTTWKKQS